MRANTGALAAKSVSNPTALMFEELDASGLIGTGFWNLGIEGRRLSSDCRHANMILHAHVCVKYYFVSLRGLPRLSAAFTASFQLPSMCKDSGFRPRFAGRISLRALGLRFFGMETPV